MMKKVLLITALVALLPAIASAGKGGGGKKDTGAMNVQVREAMVKSAPDYMSSGVGKVTYGTAVNVVGKEGNWFQISSPSGWLPVSALTKSKVKADPDQKFAGAGTKHDEVALAGKGFNPQVEAQYKKDNPNLAAAFVSVDTVEGFGATDAELNQFKKAGKLR